jgi:hypothetical protein
MTKIDRDHVLALRQDAQQELDEVRAIIAANDAAGWSAAEDAEDWHENAATCETVIALCDYWLTHTQAQMKGDIS